MSVGDAKWAAQYKNQNNLVNLKDNRQVKEGVQKQETGVFKDLNHSIKITQDYVNQLKKEGKPHREQLVAELTKRFEVANGNVSEVLKQLRMEQQLRAGQQREVNIVNQERRHIEAN